MRRCSELDFQSEARVGRIDGFANGISRINPSLLESSELVAIKVCAGTVATLIAGGPEIKLPADCPPS